MKYTNILAVDGYFMKEEFIKAVTATGLKVITIARQDANMLYLYKGAQRKGLEQRESTQVRQTGKASTEECVNCATRMMN